MLGEKPRRTWDEAALRFLNESGHKRSLVDDARKIALLSRQWQGRTLADLSAGFIRDTIEALKGDVSHATRNRYLALVRTILRKAERDWGWLERAPHIRLYREPPGRLRYLTVDELRRLERELRPHQRDPFLFAVATGLRAGNVRNLRWSHVRWDGQTLEFAAGEMKAGAAHSVPLNETALAILRRNLGNHAEFVFTFRGHPIRNLNTRSFRAAVKRAGLRDVVWHDSRHTFASLLAQADVPTAVIRELGGWKSEAMVRRYAHLSPGYLAGKTVAIDRQLNPEADGGASRPATDRGEP